MSGCKPEASSPIRKTFDKRKTKSSYNIYDGNLVTLMALVFCTKFIPLTRQAYSLLSIMNKNTNKFTVYVQSNIYKRKVEIIFKGI